MSIRPRSRQSFRRHPVGMSPRRPLRRSSAVLVALALALPASAVLAGSASGDQARAGAQAKAGAQVNGCVGTDLEVRQGSTEGATSQRFTHFRIINTGSEACRLFGTPDFWYRNPQAKIIGFRSAPAQVEKHVVVLQPGGHTRVTLGRVAVPGPVPAKQCLARRAVSVDLRLAYRPFVYNLPFDARVCTTAQYRPTAYPVGF